MSGGSDSCTGWSTGTAADGVGVEISYSGQAYDSSTYGGDSIVDNDSALAVGSWYGVQYESAGAECGAANSVGATEPKMQLCGVTCQ